MVQSEMIFYLLLDGVHINRRILRWYAAYGIEYMLRSTRYINIRILRSGSEA